MDFDAFLAEKMYKAYSAFTNNKNFMGNEMPKWVDLPDSIRGAWKASAIEAQQIIKPLVSNT